VTGIEGELVIQISTLPFYQSVCSIKPIDADVSYMPAPAPHLTRKRRRGGGGPGSNGTLNFTILPSTPQTSVSVQKSGITAIQSTPEFSDMIYIDF
jgi:hypothetical protein